ncbi:hypothetical protein BMW23_0544 [Bodo saltans virus]|uniref:Uncharacterized protein n=1 Tax=Bodo saltans virus TaxID=2024608 RepID=A0A2H4UUH7_9VIRU|nr:hypothetical protein QJ851_gp0528 [Bodo saltans virus]ATZ80591.1 hypothetical protein BMW23_0544 [Bodo saltans virus]
MSKENYTIIDSLEDDPAIVGQEYVSVSFLSPNGLLNKNIYGFKVRCSHANDKVYQKEVEKIAKKDKAFDVFTRRMGTWMYWDPPEDFVEDEVFRDETQNKIMKKAHEGELKNSDKNIDLVVKKQQENKIIDDSEIDYKYNDNDYLDEDPDIPGQRFALVSYIAPEYVKNARAYYVKVSGVYKSIEDANKAGRKLNEHESKFRRFAIPVGKWALFLPSHEFYIPGKNATFTQQEQIDAYKILNELAGRYKKNFEMGAEKHTQRVEADKLAMAKEHKKNELLNQNNEKTEELNAEQPVLEPKNKDDVMNRLNKKIEEIKQNNEKETQSKPKTDKFENLNRNRSTLMNNLSKKLEEKKQQRQQQQNTILNMTEKPKETQDDEVALRLQKMKEQYNELKK